MPLIPPFDEDPVMAAFGSLAPIILREAMDSGFDAFRRSRALDPVGHADYRPTTNANMLVDRMYPILRSLVSVADPEGLELRTSLTENGRATELRVGRELYAKLKRIKDKVRAATPEDDLEVDEVIDIQVVEEGLPQNIVTGRVLRQRSPQAYTGAQLFLDGIAEVQVPDDGRDRLCLIAGFDLDLTEERLERHRIGLYGSLRSFWTRPLPELDLATIASISPSLADQVEVLRQARSS